MDGWSGDNASSDERDSAAEGSEAKIVARGRERYGSEVGQCLGLLYVSSRGVQRPPLLLANTRLGLEEMVDRYPLYCAVLEKMNVDFLIAGYCTLSAGKDGCSIKGLARENWVAEQRSIAKGLSASVKYSSYLFTAIEVVCLIWSRTNSRIPGSEDLTP